MKPYFGRLITAMITFSTKMDPSMLKELPNLLPGLSIMVLTPFSSLVQAVKRQP